MSGLLVKYLETESGDERKQRQEVHKHDWLLYSERDSDCWFFLHNCHSTEHPMARIHHLPDRADPGNYRYLMGITLEFILMIILAIYYRINEI